MDSDHVFYIGLAVAGIVLVVLWLSRAGCGQATEMYDAGTSRWPDPNTISREGPGVTPLDRLGSGYGNATWGSSAGDERERRRAPEVGEVEAVLDALGRPRKMVDAAWFVSDAENRAVLEAAPLAEGTAEEDACAAGMANYCAGIIGRPAGAFAEPTVATGFSLFEPKVSRVGCLRAGRTSIEDNAGCLESSNNRVTGRPLGPVARRFDKREKKGASGSGSASMITSTNSTSMNTSTAEHMWGRVPPPGWAPEADTNMITPDLSRLPVLPEKCVYVGANGMRIIEDCSMYTVSNPFDENM